MSDKTKGFWNNYHDNQPLQKGQKKAPNFRETDDHKESCRNCTYFDYDGWCTRYGFYSHGSAAGDDPYSALHTCDSRNTSK